MEQHQISLQEAANSMQQKENELLQLQIDATEKNTESLIELLNLLQEADESSPVAPSPIESALPDTDSCSQCGRLQSATEPTNPTTTDDSEYIAGESNNSVSSSKPEQ